MTSMRVRATADGRIVGWSELKKGRLVDTTRLSRLFLTTTLTDVIADLCAWSQEFDSNSRIEMLIPNGPATASLDIKLVAKGFEIVCARRLVRGWFPLNPIAAEFGSNYDVVVTITGGSPNVTEMLRRLRTKYLCNEQGEQKDAAELSTGCRHVGNSIAATG